MKSRIEVAASKRAASMKFSFAECSDIKIVGAQRTMYQGLWGIELSMRRILGVRYPKEKPQNGIFKKSNLLTYPHAKFHQIWIINVGVSGKSVCYTKGGRYPKEKPQNGIFF